MTATSQGAGPVRARSWTWMARAVRLELNIYASIARALVRRPAVPNGARAFAYHRPVKTVVIVFIVLSAVEIPVFDLIVRRWPALRIAVLALGIWGLTWMVGLLCAYLMRPHTAGPGGIRVRNGLELDIRIPWDDVYEVAIAPRVDDPHSPRIIESGEARALAVRIGNATNIEIVLDRRTTVKLPGLPPKGGLQEITAVRLWVDEPREFLAQVGQYLQ